LPFRTLTLRQAQGEDLFNPHAEPVEASLRKYFAKILNNILPHHRSIMAFSSYKNLATVMQEFHLHYAEAPFDRLLPPIAAPLELHDTIAFNLKEMAYDVSEAMIGESLLFPILREAWKPFRKELMLWSHTAITYNEELSGIPDYLFAKQSALGKIVLDKPYIAVVEAKKDDFTGGWGQCAVELYVAQHINANPDLEIFGIVSNGLYWQFGSLQRDIFTKYDQVFDVKELDALYTTLVSILTVCKTQLS
jgi:hypothetical protein